MGKPVRQVSWQWRLHTDEMVANFIQVDTILQFRIAQCFPTAHIQARLGDNGTTTTCNREIVASIASPLDREVQREEIERTRHVSSFYKVTVTFEVVVEALSPLSNDR